MKQIELTEEQKKKLLEMCKVLFSEYSVWTFEEISQLGAYSYDYNCLLFSNEAEHHLYKAESAHWFEFTILHLSKKILDKIENIEKPYLWTFQGKILNLEEHAIDYLYDIFKKLKI